MASEIAEKYAQRADKYESLYEDKFDAIWNDILPRINIQEDARVLDVGCGTGRTLRHIMDWFQRNRLQVKGVDLCADMIAQAREKTDLSAIQSRGQKIDWEVQDCLTFLKSCPEEEYDLIIAASLLAYVEATELFPLINKAAKKGGRLIVISAAFDFTESVGLEIIKALVMEHFFSIHWSALFKKLTLVKPAGEITRILIASGFKKIVIEMRSMSVAFPNPLSCLKWIDETGLASQYLDIIKKKNKEKVLADIVKYAERKKIPIFGEEVKRDAPFVLNWPVYVISAEK